jgi:hypothetical protein
MTINVPQVAQGRNNNTSKKPTGKTRNRFKPSIQDIDELVYVELQIEDDRNAETIAHKLGAVELVPMPNGGRGNCRYRKLKKTGRDRLKAIDLFNAPHYENWNDITRMQLIERYMRIGWNVIPLKKDRQPIMDREDWAMLTKRDKLTMFSDQVFGVGMWANNLTMVEGGCGVDTLIAKTPDGFNAYFILTPLQNPTLFVVLPPTEGYHWINLVPPRHLYHLFKLGRFFDQRKFLKRIASTYNNKSKKYVLPDHLAGSAREDHLFRHGRSFRACGASRQETINELVRVNEEICDPPINRLKLEKIIRRVWELENDPSFAAAGEKLKKS